MIYTAVLNAMHPPPLSCSNIEETKNNLPTPLSYQLKKKKIKIFSLHAKLYNQILKTQT